MFVTNQEFVPYTNPDCALPGFLSTLKVEYSHEITLDPADFGDPNGYVIVWERCCRNWSTKNLVNPGYNGMTYTLHFPPIVDSEGNPAPVLTADKLGLATSAVLENSELDIQFKLLTDENLSLIHI